MASRRLSHARKLSLRLAAMKRQVHLAAHVKSVLGERYSIAGQEPDSIREGIVGIMIVKHLAALRVARLGIVDGFIVGGLDPFRRDRHADVEAPVMGECRRCQGRCDLKRQEHGQR